MELSTPIIELSFTAIDFESAGVVSGRTDVPIQIGMAEWQPQTGVGECFVSYLHTQQPIAWSAQKMHGISVADLVAAPDLRSLWPTLKTHLQGKVVVAHGKGTEKKFLRAFPGHGFGPWVDTLLLARATWPQWPDHSLGVVCEALELTRQIEQHCPGKAWHDALFDAVASVCLLEKILQITGAFHVSLSHILQPDQSAWHRYQSRSR